MEGLIFESEKHLQMHFEKNIMFKISKKWSLVSRVFTIQIDLLCQMPWCALLCDYI